MMMQVKAGLILVSAVAGGRGAVSIAKIMQRKQSGTQHSENFVACADQGQQNLAATTRKKNVP